ncbi:MULTISPECIES: hypothetical protein [Gammaproteobacteria]|uniref:hypothetical protein n=1 Tax=Gammaproteobacteria TaxID=1236 RepID=UPI000DD0D1DD|nr:MULTISPECIES: hypothetical protein [Gammaproteobacteria]RTE87017.1 hypothetical protein DQX04_01095 [Aliidiomarina sp. B3213]TCZ93193.1 hypothetical protein EYQ95_04205 [Lysobacter sp. N42]
MNQIQRAIALVTAPLGLIFLLSEQQDLWRFIVSTELNWHKAFMPAAWGIILGAVLGLMKVDVVQKFATWMTWISTALMTFGAVGCVVIYFEHREWVFAWPTMWLFSFGLGLYLLMVMQLKFSQKSKEGK